MLEQLEIRRRIRAAMAMADIPSWEALARVVPLSRSTIKDLGTVRGRADEKHLRVIAAACDVPYSWFTVPDFRAAIARHEEDPSLAERVEALEGRIDAIQKRLGDA